MANHARDGINHFVVVVVVVVLVIIVIIFIESFGRLFSFSGVDLPSVTAFVSLRSSAVMQQRAFIRNIENILIIVMVLI